MFAFGAFLVKADLGGADLQKGRLAEANLEEANLQWTSLGSAAGLIPSQIKEAKNWQLAFYSDDFLKELGLPANHNETVKKKLAEIEKEKEKTTTKP